MSGTQNPDTLVVRADEAVMAIFVQETGIASQGRAVAYQLEQNYPNPFNAVTVIEWTLGSTGHARLEIVDTLGRIVRTLVNQPLAQGAYKIEWDGKDHEGKDAGAGLYFCRIISPRGVKWMKMSLLRYDGKI